MMFSVLQEAQFKGQKVNSIKAWTVKSWASFSGNANIQMASYKVWISTTYKLLWWLCCLPLQEFRLCEHFCER